MNTGTIFFINLIGKTFLLKIKFIWRKKNQSITFENGLFSSNILQQKHERKNTLSFFKDNLFRFVLVCFSFLGNVSTSYYIWQITFLWLCISEGRIFSFYFNKGRYLSCNLTRFFDISRWQAVYKRCKYLPYVTNLQRCIILLQYTENRNIFPDS